MRETAPKPKHGQERSGAKATNKATNFPNSCKCQPSTIRGTRRSLSLFGMRMRQGRKNHSAPPPPPPSSSTSLHQFRSVARPEHLAQGDIFSTPTFHIRFMKIIREPLSNSTRITTVDNLLAVNYF